MSVMKGVTDMKFDASPRTRLNAAVCHIVQVDWIVVCYFSQSKSRIQERHLSYGFVCLNVEALNLCRLPSATLHLIPSSARGCA